MTEGSNTATNLLVEWSYGYPSLELITEMRNDLQSAGLSPEARDRIDQLFVWLAAGAFLPVSEIVLSHLGASDDAIDITQKN